MTEDSSPQDHWIPLAKAPYFEEMRATELPGGFGEGPPTAYDSLESALCSGVISEAFIDAFRENDDCEFVIKADGVAMALEPENLDEDLRNHMEVGAISEQDAEEVRKIVAPVWSTMCSEALAALRLGKTKMFASVGSCAIPHFREIPAAAIPSIKIADWSEGRGVSSAGEQLYLIHVALPVEEAAAEPEAFAIPDPVPKPVESAPTIMGGDSPQPDTAPAPVPERRFDFCSVDPTSFVPRDIAAEYLKARYGHGSPKTLAKLATRGGGPPYEKSGTTRVVYKIEELDAWALRRMSGPKSSTSDKAGDE